MDGIFGAECTGGWEGTEWITSVASGPEKNIRTWGELGLTGEWSDKPIDVYGYNINFHFPRDFAEKVFKGGYKWNEKVREYANLAKPDGSGLIGGGRQFRADLSKDKYGIAYTDIRGMNAADEGAGVGEKRGRTVHRADPGERAEPYLPFLISKPLLSADTRSLLLRASRKGQAD